MGPGLTGGMSFVGGLFTQPKMSSAGEGREINYFVKRKFASAKLKYNLSTTFFFKCQKFEIFDY